MASAPSEPRPVLGRLDKAGRLVAADPELEALQREAGSALGQTLALPQVAAVAQLARKLGTAGLAAGDRRVDRPRHRAVGSRDARRRRDRACRSKAGPCAPAAGPRLALVAWRRQPKPRPAAPRNEWAADEELRLISLSADLAELLGVDLGEVAGPAADAHRSGSRRMTTGEMPLISALAARRGFHRPARAQPRRRQPLGRA